MVNTYSRASQGEQPITKNYKVKDFACKDGTDTVLIDRLLADMLQAANDFFGIRLNINSAYRTISHNKAVGGSANSNHITGRAIDISIPATAISVDYEDLAMFFEARGLSSIIIYTYGTKWMHIGSTLTGSKLRKASADTQVRVDTFLPVLRRQYLRFTNKDKVWRLQKLLNREGLYSAKDYDGKFGPLTQKAVKKFQDRSRLDDAGVCGPATWKALYK
jgi:hypothetical protein